MEPDSTNTRTVFFSCDQYESLSLCPTPSFSRFLSANVGFINLNCPRKVISSGSHHGTAKFMQPCPSRPIAPESENPLQPQSVCPIFLTGDMPHSAKPNNKWLFCVLENRSSCYRVLVSALRAFVQAICHSPAFLMSTTCAAEAIWPAKRKQIAAARAFRAKPLLKLLQRLGVNLHRDTLHMGCTGVKCIPP